MPQSSYSRIFTYYNNSCEDNIRNVAGYTFPGVSRRRNERNLRRNGMRKNNHKPPSQQVPVRGYILRGFGESA